MTQTALLSHANRYAGPAAADALTGAGFTVFCHDLAFADSAAREAYVAQHPGVLPLAESAPEEAVAAVVDRAGSIDVLFANHFQTPESKSITETSTDEYHDILNRLVVEPYRFAKPVILNMSDKSGGRIIFVTSAAPLKPGAHVSLYSSARAAVNSLVKTLAKELGPDNIGVFAIAPNFFASDDTYPPAAFENNERFRAMVERQVPLKRLSNAQEMDALIRYLASPESLFVTGQVIAFTGGWA